MLKRFPLFTLVVFFLFFIIPFSASAYIPGGTLNPTTIPKYETPLVIPPAMPNTSTNGGFDYYEIAVRQFTQQVLPPPFNPTTVWSYGSVNHTGTFNYPAFTIEATVERPVHVKWINDLVDENGNFLPHLLPVDQTLHWANPPRICADGLPRTDCRGINPTPYMGPVPIVTHVHGAETNQESDGFPEAWYLPAAHNLPANFATGGKLYEVFKSSSSLGGDWTPGSAVFSYPNAQRATTLWYHDHALGMTRLNVYAGPAGFYLLRGGPSDAVRDTSGNPAALPGPAPGVGADPFGTFYEIPIAVQDRSFNADGSLFYATSRKFFDGFTGPYIPGTDISPIWNPEFFGNTIVVNGRTWPVLEVEKRRYRMRFLNGSQSRFLILNTDRDGNPNNGISSQVPVWQIGAEGGFLPAPVNISTMAIMPNQLLIGLAERADVIMDFTDVPEGTEIILRNYGPDEPFGGGTPWINCAGDPGAPADCFEPADPATTGQVMKFIVTAISGVDNSTPPGQLVLPARDPLPAATNTQYLSLNEEDSAIVCLGRFGRFIPCFSPRAVEPFGPRAALLGTVDPVAMEPTPLMWNNEITEEPGVGTTEIWEMWNFTEDAHPIHVHTVQFEVLGREPIGGGTSIAGTNSPLPSETGTKDTVIVYPGEIARIKATFPYAGMYVWHCHIIEHEDNEMMRPYCIKKADGTRPAACDIADSGPM